MAEWKWKLATVVSTSAALAALTWNALALRSDPPVVKPEPVAVERPASEPPRNLLRAYPHLADAIREDPVEALASALPKANGAQACELIEALGKLGGEKAAAALGDAITSRQNPRVRRCAVDALCEIDSSTSTSWLSELVRDRDETVRWASMRALAARDEHARGVVVDLAHDEDERVRREAMLALAEAGAPGAAEAIIEELASADLGTQVLYLRALEKGKSEAAMAALEQLAVRGHAGVRADAIRAWAHVAGDQATDKLVGLLSEGPTHNRQHVLEALGEIGSDRARAALREAAASSDSEVATGALRVLAETEGDDIRELMIDELRSVEPDRLSLAIEYVVSRGDMESVPRLAELTRGPSNIASIAIRGLARLGGVESREALVGLAAQPGPMRQQVLSALADAGVPAPERCKIFERIAMDGGVDSGAALRMLSQEGGPGPTTVLARILDRGGPLVLEAADLLAARGDPESFAALTRAARSSDRAQRVAAIRSLGNTREPKAAAAFRTALSDEDPDIRNAAFEGLLGLGGEHAERAVREALRSDESDRKSRALYALGDMRSKSARSELIRWAGDDDLGGTALAVLAGTEPSTAARLAREAMGSDVPNRQMRALDVVRSLDPESAGAIVEAGLRSGDDSVVSTAVGATHVGQGAGVTDALIAILRNDDADEWIRRRAAWTLRGMGKSTSEPLRSELDAVLGPEEGRALRYR